MTHSAFRIRPAIGRGVLVSLLITLFASSGAVADGPLTPADVARLRIVTGVSISPDGKWIAYTLAVPRDLNSDDDGGAWVELHVVGPDGASRPFITGEVNVGNVAWKPDSSGVSFLAKRGKDKHRSLYVIPVDGGEARRVLSHEDAVGGYSWAPGGDRVAFLAHEKEDKKRKERKDKGFSQEIYEEEDRAQFVWIGTVDDEDAKPRKLELPGSATDVSWSPAGDRLAVVLAPSPRIDDEYMKKRTHVVDVESGRSLTEIATVGKLGATAWSPDGKQLALIGAENINDPAEGRLLIADASTGAFREVLPNYPAHVAQIAWSGPDTVMYVAENGMHSTLATVGADGSAPKTLIPVGGPVLRALSLSRDGTVAALTADSPTHPAEAFRWTSDGAVATRLTDSNPWLADHTLAPQETVAYKARDGLDLGGVLVRPLDEQPGQRYPLILAVHGGPEASVANGWVTSYSNPGQVAAGAGFAVFYPNYRGSTGRGVAFSKMGQADYAGKEFDDVVDAIDHLVNAGLVDRAKVGITGGSYGGYASAWGATALTEHFAASVMFVGVSDLVSKFGTTDIPIEMYEVHARKWPWDDWDFYRERSPIYHAAKSKTPLLILHGKDDPRVHPSQSLELYRYMKSHGKTVRLVWYPGEGHGNRRAASRLDYNLRMMRWFEHYLKGPGGKPPEIELDYGLEKDKDEKPAEEEKE